MAGVLFTFEGGEAAGKDTQVEKLKANLAAEGYKIYTKVLQEPGTTREGEFDRTALKHNADTDYSKEHFEPVAQMAKDFDWDPSELAYGYFRARHNVFRKTIKPLLDDGYILLHNRSIDSTAVYQGHFGDSKLLPWIRGENQRILDSTGVQIHKTYLVDISVEEVQKRLTGRDTAEADRFDKMGVEGFNKLRNGYLAEAKEFPQRIHIVDGEKSPEAVYENLYALIKSEFDTLGITPQQQ